ncbi:hypothetical protein BG011_002287 [Mortierella polycephala]|uniref:F-box domain-containing protein n=1 Tax=Mortierella polycephala TaxID=41804 RepID=A0A9P6Q6V5_9FUNG|nr:hypothetical protein BG011_002287 [Mortierella polycephala]
MVLADYLQAREQQQKTGADNHAKLTERQGRALSLTDSPLSRYGPLVHSLNEPSAMLGMFTMASAKMQLKSMHLAPLDLFRHFLSHCTNVKKLSLSDRDVMDDSVWESVTEFLMPHLQELHICTSNMTASEYRFILSQCPATLETLYFDLWFSDDEDGLEVEVDGGVPLTRLKKLTISLCESEEYPTLSAFLPRCAQVESLVLLANHRSPPILQFSDAIRNHMPNINSISITYALRKCKLVDKDCASLLSACPMGLHTVDLGDAVQFGKLSCDALLRHATTLEKFSAVTWTSSSSSDLKRIITSCPKLHTLKTIFNHSSANMRAIPFIDAEDFIDWDKDSKILTPWPCESTLKVLKIKVSSIPRPDAIRDVYRMMLWRPIKKAHPADGGLTQHRVYERLSRFTNLRELWLGHIAHKCHNNVFKPLGSDNEGWVSGFFTFKPLGSDEESCYSDVDTGEDTDEEKACSNKYPEDHQDDCLEMSLESGLGQLGTLKDLRVLNTNWMMTNIGPSEVQWMAEHWPKLRTFDGLHKDNDEQVEASKWIEENCPRIHVGMEFMNRRF